MRILVFAFLLFANTLSAQVDYVVARYGLQYGASIKATIEMGTSKDEPCVMFRLAGDIGISSNFLTKYIHPSVNGEFMIYNGGNGNRKVIKDNGKRNHPVMSDFILSFTATGGVPNQLTTTNTGLRYRNTPLYYFSDHVYPALQNPYKASLSLGTNFIISPWSDKDMQQVGFFNLHVLPVQISYYNDGAPPFNTFKLGDLQDRYYTGGITLSYHNMPNTFLNLVEVSYKKFTGYTETAFEAANKLNLASVSYRRKNQELYNKSIWSINIANVKSGLAAKLSYYNSIRWDVQHLVHFTKYDTYHYVPYRGFATLAVSGYRTHSKIGLQ